MAVVIFPQTQAAVRPLSLMEIFSYTNSFSIPGFPTETAPITNTNGFCSIPRVRTYSLTFTSGANLLVPTILTPMGRYWVTGFLMTAAREADPSAERSFNLVRSYAIISANLWYVLGIFILALISMRTPYSVLMKTWRSPAFASGASKSARRH